MTTSDRAAGRAPGKIGRRYAKSTGEPIWHALDDAQAYASPMLVTLAGVPQVLIVTAFAGGRSTIDAGLLWSSLADRHGHQRRAALLVAATVFPVGRLRSRRRGVPGIARRDGLSASLVAEHPDKNKSPARSCTGATLRSDEAILACIDAATGDLKWKGAATATGRPSWPATHRRHNRDWGAGAGKGDAGGPPGAPPVPAIEGKTWNHPVIAGGRRCTEPPGNGRVRHPVSLNQHLSHYLRRTSPPVPGTIGRLTQYRTAGEGRSFSRET